MHRGDLKDILGILFWNNQHVAWIRRVYTHKGKDQLLIQYPDAGISPSIILQKKLKRKIEKMEKKLNLSRMKTPFFAGAVKG
jgi:hypothetical protein